MSDYNFPILSEQMHEGLPLDRLEMRGFLILVILCGWIKAVMKT